MNVKKVAVVAVGLALVAGTLGGTVGWAMGNSGSDNESITPAGNNNGVFNTVPVGESGLANQSYVVTSGSGYQPGISVSGEGQVTATPDLATISLGVQAKAGTVAQAQAIASDAMNKIRLVLATTWETGKEIQTSNFNFSPVYNWDKDTNRQYLDGYQVTNSVTVKVRDVTKAGTIVDAVATAGGDVTQVQGISFGFSDPTTYVDQAREQAMKSAIAKAKQMATLAGVTLGKPVYITENGGYAPMPPVFYGKAMAADSAGATPISTGETTISSSVQILFAIE